MKSCVSGTISIRFVAAGIAGVGSVAIVSVVLFLETFYFHIFPIMFHHLILLVVFWSMLGLTLNLNYLV